MIILLDALNLMCYHHLLISIERGESMNNNQRRSLGVSIVIALALLISACTQSLSSPPVSPPTALPDSFFVEPFPSVENPMEMIQEFAKQTAIAQTAAAGGGEEGEEIEGSKTPEPIEITPDVVGDETETPEPEIAASTPTNAEIQPAATAVAPGERPATYTLQKGEFPYCIARRFNVNPLELLSLSGLTVAQGNSLSPGTVLKIPQSGAFPPPRHLIAHPATYTVVSSNETLHSIACKFGDVDPNAIATANGISVSTRLTVGQQLQIP
jgi:LysM repeat protein